MNTLSVVIANWNAGRALDYTVTMAPATLQLFFKLSPPAAFAIAFQDVLFWAGCPKSWSS
jgi:hypothetical protein